MFGADATQCNCLHGTPVIDSTGNCRCVSEIPSVDRMPDPPLSRRDPTTINYYLMNAADPGAKSAPTIAGFPAIVVIGVAAVGLWMFSSMDGKN